MVLDGLIQVLISMGLAYSASGPYQNLRLRGCAHVVAVLVVLVSGHVSGGMYAQNGGKSFMNGTSLKHNCYILWVFSSYPSWYHGGCFIIF